jgi:hypothetical protein
MRETLEVLETLEVSREPGIRRQLDRLNARVSLLDRERLGFQQTRLRLKSVRDSLMPDRYAGQPVTGFELQSTAASARLIDREIAQVFEDELNREQQLSLARTRAQRVEERLAICLRRQAKLEHAIKRLGKQAVNRKDRQDEAQIDQLASLQWQRGSQS